MAHDALLTEVNGLLEEQALVLEKAFWQQHRYDDGALLKALESAPASARNGTQEAQLNSLKNVNRSVHDASDRVGAKDLMQSLITKFGFKCYLCGAEGKTATLHVDHVVPLARSGAPRDLNNLQLLCKHCNLGKSDLESHLLPRALTTNNLAEPTGAIRFKRLMLTGVEGDGGRVRGQCEECQGTSKDRVLVVLRSAPFAANLITTRVTCQGGCQ